MNSKNTLNVYRQKTHCDDCECLMRAIPLELPAGWGWLWKVRERVPYCPENCPLWGGSSFHVPREDGWRLWGASAEFKR